MNDDLSKLLLQLAEHRRARDPSCIRAIGRDTQQAGSFSKRSLWPQLDCLAWDKALEAKTLSSHFCIDGLLQLYTRGVDDGLSKG